MERLGVIEGFFGRPWSWAERHGALDFLSLHAFGGYLYAPKADRHLRASWRQAHSPEDAALIQAFSAAAAKKGIAFGMGLSPLGLHASWDQEGEGRLLSRVEELRAFGLDFLGLFFDDMRGDIPGLARSQAQMVQAVHKAFPDLHLMMCPTYYTPHAVLDKVFGQRPDGYLGELGAGLPADVEVFWTGEQVCSKSYDAPHLEQVARELGRKVAIWDNYPVNDGPRMCKHLHVRAPAAASRPKKVADQVTSWWINPMNQPALSRLPLAAMSASLRGQEERSQRDWAERVWGGDVAACLVPWFEALMDQGFDQLTDEQKRSLSDQLGGVDGSAAAEVCAFLAGESIVGPECLTDTEVEP